MTRLCNVGGKIKNYEFPALSIPPPPPGGTLRDGDFDSYDEFLTKLVGVEYSFWDAAIFR